MLKKLSALVLDDNPTSLWSISMMLEKFNFRVFPFQTVEAALDFVKSGAGKEANLDLVLVEVRLNNMALETLTNPELRHHMNELQVPLITMSSYDNYEALPKCMTLGARFHVRKPLDTGSFNMLRHKALEHRSKRATPRGPTRTRGRTVRKSLSNPKSNGYEEAKRPGRIKWTIELHEKFLEAIEVLGGEEFSTPDGILRQMNVKDLTSQHIASHLQKHRLHKRNAKQGGQRQGNASMKPVSDMIIPAQNEATSESITPGVDANSELYPLRLWTEVKKRSVEAAAVKTYRYTCSSGIYRDDIKSVWHVYEKNLQKEFSGSNKRCLSSAVKTYRYTCSSGIYRDSTKSLWDVYEKNLQKEFYGSNKRWLPSSIDQCPAKNRVVITDKGVPNEPHKTAGEIVYCASKSSGSSSPLTSEQVGVNNHTEADRGNDNMGSINLPEGEIGYGVCIGTSGSSSLSTSDQAGENNPTEVARDTDNLGYGAYIESSGSSSLLKSDQVGQINRTEATRDNYEQGNINLLEGIMEMEYTAPMDPSDAWAHLESDALDLTCPSAGSEEVDSFFISQCEGSQEQQSLGQDDLQQIIDGLRSLSLNIGEPIIQGPQEQQSPALQDLLQVAENAWNDSHRSVGPINMDELAQGSQEQQSPGQDDLQQICDDAWNDVLRSVALINIGEPMVQGPQEQQGLALEDLLQVGDNAQNDSHKPVGPINIDDEPMSQGSQEPQSLGLEDLQQINDYAWDDALRSGALINIGEPMAQGSQDQRSLGLEDLLQVGGIACNGAIGSASDMNIDEPIAQEAGDAPMDDPVFLVAQCYELWGWSPQVAGDYGMLLF